MVSKTEQSTSAIDTFKLMTAVLVLIAGVVGFYYFEEESQLLRVLGMLAVAVAALFNCRDIRYRTTRPRICQGCAYRGTQGCLADAAGNPANHDSSVIYGNFGRNYVVAV